MIISAVVIPQFGPEESKRLIAGLTDLHSRLNGIRPAGFAQSMLLREDHGQAILLTMWDSKQHLQEFVSSDRGRKLAALFREVIPDKKLEYRDYYVTWQSDSLLSLTAQPKRVNS
jgi:heme-degrading monooxygenase HmoA